MHILVTNDDSVNAPGLLALVQAMRTVGQVSVLAPDHNWSASGHVKTLHRPLRVKEVVLADNTPALATDGAPSDCVALATLGILPKPIDMVVSGINPYANVSNDVTYSGTVTAAMEGAIWGLPSLAFSLDSHENGPITMHYDVAAAIAARIVKIVIQNGMPSGILFNVNIPNLPMDQIKGIRITRQGLRIYRDELVRRLDPRGKPYYWIGGDAPTGVPEEGTDIGVLDGNFVSITPLHLDLTAYDCMQEIKDWEWDELHTSQ